MPDHQIILNAIDFIETNLQATLSVADMADSVSYSLFHFCRTFNRVTHLTPYDYLIRRRLTESINPLLHSKRNILDIALEYQFTNPETYSRAFRRLVGILPSELRRGEKIDGRRLMPRWSQSHLTLIANGHCLLPKVEQWGTFKVVGLMTLVGENLKEIPKLWSRFLHEFQTLYGRSPQSDLFGISFNSGDNSSEGYLYLAGVKAESFASGAGALVTKQIPTLEIAKFIHKGSLSERQVTLDYAYHSWLPRSGKQFSRPWIIEIIQDDVWESEDRGIETILAIPIK